MIILIREVYTKEYFITEINPRGPTVRDFDVALRESRADHVFYGRWDMFNLETGEPIPGWTWGKPHSEPTIIADPLLREAALADFRAKRKEHHDTERKTD